MELIRESCSSKADSSIEDSETEALSLLRDLVRLCRLVAGTSKHSEELREYEDGLELELARTEYLRIELNLHSSRRCF